MIPQASGQLVVQDPDAGESIFAVPDTSAGLYGAFAFDPDLGIWSYALTPGKAALVALGARMSTSPRWPPTPAFASRSVVSRRSRSARRWRHPATSMATVAPTWSWAAAGPPSLSSGSRTRRS
ncbi:MAG TPA: VCBS domain-containing protein [Falsiroseomonas sp.]|nr:VCBS domain-containing protein [Falsiroseomonas sp.]